MPTADELVQAGRDQAKRQKWAAAIAAYQEALQLDPHHAAAHCALAEARQRLSQAEQHYRAVLEQDPQLAPALLGLGEICEAQLRFEEARAAYARFAQVCNEPRKFAEVQARLARIDNRPFQVCDNCGSVTTLGQYYHKAKGGKTLCPRCLFQEQIKEARGSSWFNVFAVVAYILALVFAYQVVRPIYYLMVNLIFFLPLIFLLILPHELAHAGMAWLLGGQVLEIRVGVGPVRWERFWGKLKLSLRRYPFAGACASVFPSLDFVLLRSSLVVAAGLLFNIAMILLFLPGFQLIHWGTTYALGETIVFVNGLQLLLNLVPRRIEDVIDRYTDGGQLWLIITGKTPARLAHMSYFAAVSEYAWQRKAYQEALAAAEAGLALYPDSVVMENLRAILYLELGRPTEAVASSRSLLAAFQDGKPIRDIGIPEKSRDIMRAILMNNMAYAIIVGDHDDAALQEACALAQQAYLMAPWLAPIEGTWGAVLVESGRVELGLAYLDDVLPHQESARDQASTLAYLALAHHRLGHAQEAADFLDRALALDAQHYVVKKVQAKVAPVGAGR